MILDPEILTGEKSLSHDEILTRLKGQCNKIDFQERVYPDVVQIKKEIRELNDKLKVQQSDVHVIDSLKGQIDLLEKTLEDFKLKNSHYLIITIEEILSIAKGNNWDICKNNGFVYLYNGAYWKAIDKEGLQKFFGETAELLSVPKFEARLYVFRENLLKQFHATAHLPRPKKTKKNILVNFQNGTLEINKGNTSLRQFSSSDFITYQLPFNYDPGAACPIWKNFLNEVLNDIEKQNVLSEYMASAFLNNKIIKLEKVLMLYGSGANGKSVVYEVMSALFGEENISNFSLSQLTDEKGYHVAQIVDKLINYSSETGSRMQSDIFKNLASGEPIGVRLPYMPPFMATDYAKLVFNTNVLPKEGIEQTDAFFRRFLLIPFDVTIPEHKQDKELHLKIIETELPGVFNWVMEGLHRLIKQKGFSRCEAASKKLDEFRTQSDTVRSFIDDKGYQKSVKASKPLKELYIEYTNYCAESGHRPVSLNPTFSDRVRAAGYEIERQNLGNVVWISVASVGSVAF